jgi:hypothetical protein
LEGGEEREEAGKMNKYERGLGVGVAESVAGGVDRRKDAERRK